MKNVLPDFIIIGGQRCGTTSLFHYLSQYDQICTSSKKEVHYFDNNFKNDIEWYKSNFPFFWKKRIGSFLGKKCIVGEASPYYIFHPLAMERIKKIIPNVKIIVLLRNPIDRAYSHYNHEVSLGKEKLTFEEAIKAEKERLNNEEEKIINDANYYSFNHQHYSYISRGEYAKQIIGAYEKFDRENILVIRSEDMYENPGNVVRKVLEFLGTSASVNDIDFRVFNKLDSKKMDKETRNYLVDYFRPLNSKLFDFLQRDFNWDK